MKKPVSKLQEKINSGKPVILAEVRPPKTGDADAVRKTAKLYLPHVCALGISDNRDKLSMSALAAAAITAGEGLEPVLHMVTRDRNRIALVSDALGACALGVRNILCTGGTHQSLGEFQGSKNVYDLDPVQLMQALSSLEGEGPFLGGVANPFSGPEDLQMAMIAKKISAGAKFFVTQPVEDPAAFGLWWKKITASGLDKKAAFIAGIHVSKGEAKKALDTAGKLLSMKGLRGLEVSGEGDDEAAVEVLKGINA